MITAEASTSAAPPASSVQPKAQDVRKSRWREFCFAFLFIFQGLFMFVRPTRWNQPGLFPHILQKPPKRNGRWNRAAARPWAFHLATCSAFSKAAPSRPICLELTKGREDLLLTAYISVPLFFQTRAITPASKPLRMMADYCLGYVSGDRNTLICIHFLEED